MSGQRLPAVAREDLLVGLVGELGVRDRELALQLVVAADLVEALVGLGVDAGDEERGDRGDAARVPAALDEALEPADVGLGDLAMAVEREDQRDVDRDAARDRLLDRRQALLGGRDLHEQVLAVDQRVQALGLLDRALGVVGEVRVDLERDPAVLAVAVVVDLLEQVAGALDVADGELEEDLLRLRRLLEDLAQLLVVGVAVGDRALEDRRVGGDAADALVDQALQVALLDEVARQEVDPHALAVFVELLKRCCGHVGSPREGGLARTVWPARVGGA